MQAQHLTAYEAHFPELTVLYIAIAQVTVYKTAFDKMGVVQETFGKITFLKNTMVILALGQSTFRKLPAFKCLIGCIVVFHDNGIWPVFRDSRVKKTIKISLFGAASLQGIDFLRG